MSYREENGQVVLTMTREDYQEFLLAFGHWSRIQRGGDGKARRNRLLEILNRVNRGNPNYTPYQVAEEKP